MKLLASLPPELCRRILTEYTTGKDLSTLAMAMLLDNTNTHHQRIALEVIEIGQQRVHQVADFVETKSMQAKQEKKYLDNGDKDNKDDSDDDEIDPMIAKAVCWIRGIVNDPRPNLAEYQQQQQKQQEQPDISVLRNVMRRHSEEMAFLDFLEHSILHYSDPHRGHFCWPVWMGQVCVEGTSPEGTRLRSTARVVLTTPLQGRPSFIPGSGLLKNQRPASVFRCELYNMIPLPPWGCLLPFSKEDKRVLQPVAQRLHSNGHTAVPAGFYHTTDILDVRIITKGQARRLLSSRSWRPRTDWIVRSRNLNNYTGGDGGDDDDDEGNTEVVDDDADDDDSMGLLCCWQDDSAELANDREYLAYILDMWRVRQRLEKASMEVSCREYAPI